jgi:hypothetical protein
MLQAGYQGLYTLMPQRAAHLKLVHLGIERYGFVLLSKIDARLVSVIGA